MPSAWLKWLAGGVAVVLVGQAARLLPRDASSDVGEDRVVSRSIESSSEIEPHLASTLRGDLAVVWMGERGGRDDAYASFIGARVSHDRAQTWEPISIVRSPEGKLAADPTVVFRRGEPVITWLGFRRAAGRRQEQDVYSATLDHEPVRVSPASDPPNAIYDRPYSAMSGDRLYVAYGREVDGKKSIVLATSDDGHTFKYATIADSGEMPTVCASGESIVVAFYDRAASGVTVANSTDSGQSFTRYFASSGREYVGVEAPSCVIDGPDVWIAYGVNDSLPPYDPGKSAAMDFVTVLRSRDGGKTTLDRSTVRPGAKIMHPALALRTSGSLDLAYLAGSQDGDVRGRIGVARVTSSGSTRTPRTVREPVVFAPKHDDAAWGGDYLGLAATAQVSFAAVVDTSVLVNDAGKGGVERHIAIVPVPEE